MTKICNIHFRNNQLKINLLLCIKKILSTHNISSFRELQVILCIVLKEFRQNEILEKSKPNSEELADVLLDIVIFSLRNCHSNVLEELYGKNSINILSNLCLTSVRIIENHKHRELKSKAIQCLKILYYADSVCDFQDKIIRDQAANCLYLFIPKIIKVLVQISIGDDVQGNHLKIVSISLCYF